MFKCKVESIKSLKPTVTEEGEVQVIKGSFVFDVSLAEAGMLNGQDVIILTEEEFNGRDLKMSDVFERLDTIGSSILKIAQIVKEIDESKPNVGSSQTESV